MRNGSVRSTVVYVKKSNFSYKIHVCIKYIWVRDLSCGLEFRHLKTNNFCDKGVFFHYSLATSTTNWVQIVTNLLFCAYVETELTNWLNWSLRITKGIQCLKKRKWPIHLVLLLKLMAIQTFVKKTKADFDSEGSVARAILSIWVVIALKKNRSGFPEDHRSILIETSSCHR